MIAQTRGFDGDVSDQSELVLAAQEGSSSENADETGGSADPYAAAELQRRLERAESMIRKAHEQFL